MSAHKRIEKGCEVVQQQLNGCVFTRQNIVDIFIGDHVAYSSYGRYHCTINTVTGTHDEPSYVLTSLRTAVLDALNSKAFVNRLWNELSQTENKSVRPLRARMLSPPDGFGCAPT